jgi:hypothetical protein
MIASHIKKNKMDSHISIYLKEIAFVRKQTRRDQLMVKITPQNGQSDSQVSESRGQSPVGGPPSQIDDKNGSNSKKQSSNFLFPDNISRVSWETNPNDSETGLDATSGPDSPWGIPPNSSKSDPLRFNFSQTHVRFEDEHKHLITPKRSYGSRPPTPQQVRLAALCKSQVQAPPVAHKNTQQKSEKKKERQKDFLLPLYQPKGGDSKSSAENSSDDSEYGVV